MTMTEIKRPTPRAIKLTEDSLEIITKQKDISLLPSVDELLNTVLYPDEYYFVVDCPGVTPDKTISWVLMPDFMFEKRFRFGTTPNERQLFSVIPTGARRA